VGQRFTQVSNTPFLTPPLANIFGETGSSAKAFNEVLNGSFVVPLECGQYVIKVLIKLAQPPAIQQIELPLTEQYIQG